MPKSGKTTAPGSRRRRLRKLVLWFCLTPVIFWVGSNLFLLTPWGKNILLDRLNTKTSLRWEVDRITWSPWSGVTLTRLSARFHTEPEESPPMLCIEKTQIKPYWIRALRGELRPKQVTIESPQLQVSVEQLGNLLSAIRPAKPSAFSTAQKPIPTPTKSSQETPPPPPPVDKPSPKTPAHPHPPRPVSEPSPSAHRPAASPPVTIELLNANIQIYSTKSDADLLDISGVSLQIDLLGEDSKGEVAIEKLRLPGLPTLSNLRETIHWRRPYLEIDEQSITVEGVKVRYVSQMMATPQFPFLIDVVIDPQPLEKLQPLEGQPFLISAEKLGARFRARGSFRNPSSWAGDAMVSAQAVTIVEKHGESDLFYEDIYAPAAFRQGTLMWDSVRALSEDLSLLSNGSISMDQGVLAVIRLVASPEAAAEFQRGVYGMPSIDNDGRWWQNLDNPDRRFRDLRIVGALKDPQIDARSRDEWLPLWALIKEVNHFVRSEMREEGKALPPIPNEKMLEHHENH